MQLDHGGHLSHGMKINFSGRLYDITAYGVREQDSIIDMEAIARLAEEHKPKLVLAGWSAYPRQLDFAAFREIADSVGAYLMVDMAHFAGLVAAGEHPSPVPYADVVTTTVHKTLGGARGGMIMAKEEHDEEAQLGRVPGPAGRAADARRRRQGRGPEDRPVRDLPRAPAAHGRGRHRGGRGAPGGGVNVLTGGTDVHLVLVDLRESELDGQQAEDRLHDIGITVNRNAVPFDPRPPAVSSGLRVGTSALATRGLQVDDFREIGRVIAQALTGDFGDAERAELGERTRALAERHPLYPQFAPAAV